MKLSIMELMDYLAQNPDESSRVLASLKLGDDYPRLISWLAQLSAEDPKLQAQRIFKSWAIELAQTDHSVDAQQTALALLNRAAPDQELLPVLSNIFHNAPNNQLQVTALATLEAWVEKNQDPALRDRIRENLVGMINDSTDEEVRERGFEAIARVGLSDETLLATADLLWLEPTDTNRSLLAMAFERASQSVRDFAVARLKQVCKEATGIETQRAALAQIVRLARGDSVATLQSLQVAHPELQPEVSGYLQILQNGAFEIAVIDRKRLEMAAAAGEHRTVP